LFAELIDFGLGVDFVVIIDPHDGQTPRHFFTVKFFKSGGLSHRVDSRVATRVGGDPQGRQAGQGRLPAGQFIRKQQRD
jgi:hypothetical protein